MTETPPWLPDEAALAGGEHLDAAAVAGYDAKAAFDPGEDVALLRSLGLGAGSTLIDLGAGTGTLALAAAPHLDRVVAVDVSPAMLAVLRRRARERGLANVEAVEAGFLAYEHAGPPADAVYSRNALHHLPDFWKALALTRVAAMLRPGGLLRLRDLAYSFPPDRAGEAIEAWLAGAPADPRVGYTRSELERHVRCEQSSFTWLLEPMLERAGFEIRRAERSPSGVFAAYVCVRAGGG